MKIFSELIGVPINVLPTKTWEESVKKAKNRECDMFMFTMNTPARKEYLNITQPIISLPMVLVAKHDTWFMSDIKEIKNKKIGMVAGYAIKKFIQEKYPDIKIIPVKDIDSGLSMVAKGDLFGFIDASYVISYKIRRDFPGELKIAGKFNERWELGTGVRNDEPFLINIFEKAAKAITQEQKEQILNRWAAIEQKRDIDYVLILKIVAIFVIIILLFLHRNAQLLKYQKQINLKNKELEDINEKLKNQKDEINFIAYHDHLTNLPNRVNFKDKLEHAIKVAKRSEKQIAILFVDLDRFKFINDTLGHHIGDSMLQTVANRIKKVLRETDTLARIGGDEFTVILENIKNENDPAFVSEKILSTVKEPIEIKNYTLNTTASIGIALYPADGKDSATITKNADNAMYLAKDEGKNNYQYYTKKLSKDIHKKLKIEHKLKSAIENKELSLVYQPQYNIQTGKVVGAEALLRWNSKELGNVPPSDFIPISEDSGAIITIGKWVFMNACKEFLKWKNMGLSLDFIAINASSVQFNQQDIVKSFEYIVDTLGIDAKNVEIEITERYIMEHTEQNKTILDELRKIGFKISVDDFGTGYSSMSYLKKLPLDAIKIDKSFIDDIPSNQNDTEITKAIIALSKSLDYKVIAEGIEQQDQEDFLSHYKCDIGQGYLFSKPLTSEEFIEFLKKKSQPNFL